MARLIGHSKEWGSRKAACDLLGPHYLIPHLVSTAARVRGEAASLPSVPSYIMSNAIVAALLHDLGKAMPEWQQKLNIGMDLPTHAEHGAALCAYKNLPLASQMVGGHHVGLHSWDYREYWGKPMRERGLAAWQHAYRDQEGAQWGELVKLAITDAKTQPFRGIASWSTDRIFGNDETVASNFFKNLSNMNDLRMGFGALVRADRADTANYIHGGFDAKTAISRSRIDNMDWTKAWKEIILPCVDRTPERTIDIARQWLDIVAAQAALRGGAEDPFYMASLVAPTGLGKFLATLSACIAVLRRDQDAASKGLLGRPKFNKIIIVEPYLTVIDDVRQQLNKFQDIALDEGHGLYKLMDPGRYDDNILDHSTGGSFRWSENQIVASETWEYPIILTSLTRFIRTLFSREPADAMRFVALSNALVVIDEPQLIPRVNSAADSTNLYETLLATATDLRRFGTAFLFSSATMPPLERGDTSISSLDLRPPAGTVREFLPPKVQTEIAKRARRVEANFMQGPFSVSEIVDEAIEANRGLLVWNTKRAAYLVYKETKAKFQGPVMLMTGLKLKKDNLATLAAAKTLFQDKKPIMLVSTSMIQSGVNIDAPEGIRQDGDLSDIIQTSGRINREGELNDGRKGIVKIRKLAMEYVYHSPTQQSAADDLWRKIAELKEQRIDPNRKIFDPQFFKKFYEMAMEQDPHCKRGVTGYKANKLAQAISALDMEEISRLGKLIGDTDAVVIIPNNEEARSLARKVVVGDSLNPSDLAALYENSITLFKEQEDKEPTGSTEIERAVKAGLVQVTMTKNLYVATERAYDPEIGFKLYK